MGDLNISRGNPSLTDSVRLELLLIFDPHTKTSGHEGASVKSHSSLSKLFAGGLEKETGLVKF